MRKLVPVLWVGDSPWPGISSHFTPALAWWWWDEIPGRRFHLTINHSTPMPNFWWKPGWSRHSIAKTSAKAVRPVISGKNRGSDSRIKRIHIPLSHPGLLSHLQVSTDWAELAWDVRVEPRWEKMQENKQNTHFLYCGWLKLRPIVFPTSLAGFSWCRVDHHVCILLVYICFA